MDTVTAATARARDTRAGEIQDIPSSLPRIRPLPRIDRTPLSFAQERLWFLDRLEPGFAAYNLSRCFEVRGEIDVGALESAFNQIVNRHEALRISIHDDAGEQFQVFAAEAPISLHVTDFSGLDEQHQIDETERYLSEESTKLFDLSRPPLLRATLARCHDRFHLLLVTLHSAAADEASMDVLLRELGDFYSAFVTARHPQPAPLSIEYTDFARWQRDTIADGFLEQQLSYWQQELEGMQVLRLYTDYPRPAKRTYAGRVEQASIPESLFRALENLARTEDATLFTVLLSAFQVLLSRYSGQEDITVGSPVENRSRLPEGLVGCFANSLVLRGDLSGQPTFREFLRRVRGTVRQAHAHQDVPCEKLVEVLRPERDASREPLFQVVFALQQNDAVLRLPGLEVTPHEIENRTAQFDLRLTVRASGRSMETRLEYSTDLFEPATARQILRHYRNVLESVAANADQRVAELPLLSAGERDRILREWNRTGVVYPRQVPIHRLFELQAMQHAGKTAVVCGTDKLNYSELNARANQLARHLCALGVSPETIVALAMGRSIEMIIAMLAVLKAGAAYLPVDPEYPKDRLEFMLRHADVRVLVTTSEWARMLSVTEVRRVLVDEDWNVIARHPDDNLSGETSAESLAYVMYTSGSQGRPKAVAIPHRGVTRLVCSANYGDLGPDEVFLNLSSPSFDLTTLEIWGPLLNGGRVAVFRSADVHARELGSALREHEVTALWLTSSLFNAIVDEEPRSLLPVRQLFIGGEALSVAHVRRAVAVLPTTELINGYGPTESTTFATTYRIPKRLPDRLPSIPIGFPISNTYVHVLDAHSQLVPLGVPGELCIGGDGLARAYLNDPERTRERFIPDPFSAEPGARLYRSGDLVRRLRDGDLEFLGRIDDQVKIRGFRVEPAEIEAAISSNSAVRSAAVIARDDSAGSRDLIAYVVRENGTENGGARDNQRLDGGMLSAYLAERLPKYMLPSAYVFLPELPRTKNGKLDRRRLPQPAPQVAAESYAEPRTGLELRLAQIFEGVLGVRPIGVHDDFFRLGGHSLMALRLMSQIEKVVGESLPLNVLFEAPTVEKLACVIRKRSVESKWDSLVPIRLAGSRPPLFCIHGIGGGVLSYAELARELPPDLPLYGLQARGFAQGEEPHTTVEDMAADYVKQIRSIQPTGPYFLAGFSFGGLIAFEMARQLYAAEERVALLALLDTAAIGVSKRLPFLAHCRAYVDLQVRRLRLHGGNLLALNLREKQQYVRGPVRTIRRKVHNRLWQLRYKLYQNFAQPLPKELQNVTQAAYLAQKQYTPGVYRGKAVLFRAEQCSPLFTADPTLGWGGVITGGVDVRVVPGNHLTIGVGENAAALARELESALQSL